MDKFSGIGFRGLLVDTLIPPAKKRDMHGEEHGPLVGGRLVVRPTGKDVEKYKELINPKTGKIAMKFADGEPRIPLFLVRILGIGPDYFATLNILKLSARLLVNSKLGITSERRDYFVKQIIAAAEKNGVDLTA